MDCHALSNCQCLFRVRKRAAPVGADMCLCGGAEAPPHPNAEALPHRGAKQANGDGAAFPPRPGLHPDNDARNANMLRPEEPARALGLLRASHPLVFRTQAPAQFADLQAPSGARSALHGGCMAPRSRSLLHGRARSFFFVSKCGSMASLGQCVLKCSLMCSGISNRCNPGCLFLSLAMLHADTLQCCARLSMGNRA